MAENFTFICKRTVVSTKPVQPGKTHQLSTLDLSMENRHLKLIYYYSTPKNLLFGEKLFIDQVRECLAQVLSYFPVIVGRLIRNEKGQWMIKCNDAGLRLIEATVKGSVESWLANVDDEKEKQLILWEEMSDTPYYWSPFYIKVTEFEEGGLSVGLSCTHMLADPKCAMLFVKAWADSLLYGRMADPPHFHQLPQRILGPKNPNIEPSTNLINHYKSLFGSPSSSLVQKTKTVTFQFTDQMVQACMSLAKLKGPQNGLHSSPFIALASLLWVCISRVKGVASGLIDMSICSDMRKVLGLDQGFFGNCMIYNKVHGHGNGVDDLALAAKAIIRASREVDKEGIMDLLEWLEHCDNSSSSSRCLNNSGLVFINLEHANPYSTVFVHNCEPIRVSCYSESVVQREKVVVLPSHPREGQMSRTVMVTLPSHEAIMLCEDKLLALYSPHIMMGANYNSWGPVNVSDG